MRAKKTSKMNENLKFLIQLVCVFVAVFAATALLMNFVISKDEVSGPSMEPGLMDKDQLVSLRHKSVKRNDIIVLYSPDAVSANYLTAHNATDKDVTAKNGNLYVKGTKVALTDHELYIKRVIGVAGDTVESKNDALYVNGKKVNQTYLDKTFAKNEIDEYGGAAGTKFTYDFSLSSLKSTHTEKVPAGSYFVMGDNRYVSHDGRAFGFIKQANVQSVVVLRYWPMNKFKIY